MAGIFLYLFAVNRKYYLSDIPFEFALTIRKFGAAYTFTRNNKLWVGFWQYGWFSRFMLLLGLFAGLYFLLSLGSILVGGISDTFFSSEAGLLNSFERIGEMVGKLFLVGSWKYVIMILAEVMVFHVIRRTLFLISGKEQDASFTAFLAAQKRMILVSFRAWIMEFVVVILIGIALSIIGFGNIKPFFVFLVQIFFLGFTITDNYFERYNISISESFKLNLSIAGVSLGLGLILYLLFLIPIAGPFLGAALGSVTAALVLYELEQKSHFTIPETILEQKVEELAK